MEQERRKCEQYGKIANCVLEQHRFNWHKPATIKYLIKYIKNYHPDNKFEVNSYLNPTGGWVY
jgi:hypothetical protein